jgi:hypothetical protein
MFMKLKDGFPVIEPQDHPQMIYDALDVSIGVMLYEDPANFGRWTKIVQDAEGNMQDGFQMADQVSEPLNPEGSATLLIHPDDFELALTAYGTFLIDSGRSQHNERFTQVEQALSDLNQARNQDKH